MLRLLILLLALSAAHAESFRLALAGDSIINRRLSVYDEPEFLALFERIRAADAAFTNFETLVHEYQFPGAAASGGSYMASPAWVVKELQWAGFTMVSTANNHTYDYGIEGLRGTLRALDAAGMAYAGSGENLARARAPAYVDTKRGRVALVACASTFSAFSAAGEQRPDMPGRPGLSPLRFTTTYTVDAPTLNALRQLAGPRSGDPVQFLGATFRAGKSLAVDTEPNRADVEAMARSIREARRQADWVVVSIHAHEGAPGNREAPAAFLVKFAHAAIDAGADVFAGHGPHVLRAVEIYKGKPILYSLANFIFENETMRFQPAESYTQFGLGLEATPSDFYDARTSGGTRSFPADKPNWESVVAEAVFDEGHKLKELSLHPITLGFGEPRTRRGRPRLAHEPLGRAIVERLAALSEPFGTRILYAEGKGTALLGR